MRYKAVITGHAAPFKWEVYALYPNDGDGVWKKAETVQTHMADGSNGGSTIKTEKVKCQGTAGTFEDAMADAREAAQQHEFETIHAKTIHEEEFDLFDIEEAINSIPDGI